MNIAAVIDVAPGRVSLAHATETQNLLLEYLGPQLGSIRLAVPRLLKVACRGAIAEKPDLLVIAGDSRAARRAGQIAYSHRLPIVFLPGHHAPRWASRLFGSLSVEEMVAALAQERLNSLRIPIGLAGGQVFFGEATCGFLPQLRQLGSDLVDAETTASAARLIAGTAAAFGRTFNRGIRILCHGAPRSASAVEIRTEGAGCYAPSSSVARLGSFACTAFRRGTLPILRASLRAATGRDWRSAQNPERFGCTKLTLEAGPTIWLLLDEEPMAFRGPVEVRYLPKSVQTFAFAADESRVIPRVQVPSRPEPLSSREPGAPVPRSKRGYEQLERRDWKPARAK